MTHRDRVTTPAPPRQAPELRAYLEASERMAFALAELRRVSVELAASHPSLVPGGGVL